MKWLFRSVAALLALTVALIGAAFLLDTSPPPRPATIPGYTVLNMQSPLRAVPVDLHIWYPTDATTEPELIGQNGLFYGAWARRDAPARPGLTPVVLLSHGSGGNAPRLAWFAAALAAQGMIVLAPNHPGTMSNDSDPLQTIRIWQRPQDLSAALDLLAADPPMGLQPDLGRVASVGFSLGGFSAVSLAGVQLSKQAFIDYCAQTPVQLDCGWMLRAGVDFASIDQPRYQASYRDPRIIASFAVDPGLARAFTPESLHRIAIPVAIINLGSPQTLPLGLNAAASAALIPTGTYETIPGAHHFSFLAECSTLGRIIIGLAGEDSICADPGLRPRAEIHAEVLAKTAAFLHAALHIPAT